MALHSAETDACRFMSFGTRAGDQTCSCFLSSGACARPTPVGDAVHFEIYKKARALEEFGLTMLATVHIIVAQARALEDVGCPAYQYYKFVVNR